MASGWVTVGAPRLPKPRERLRHGCRSAGCGDTRAPRTAAGPETCAEPHGPRQVLPGGAGCPHVRSRSRAPPCSAGGQLLLGRAPARPFQAKARREDTAPPETQAQNRRPTSRLVPLAKAGHVAVGPAHGGTVLQSHVALGVATGKGEELGPRTPSATGRYNSSHFLEEDADVQRG